MGFKGSKVQILSSRPEFRTYGERRKSFFCYGVFVPLLPRDLYI